MAKVSPDPAGCWQWMGKLTKGYGRFSWSRGQVMQAHRAAWILFRGPIPDGLEVHHVCAVKSCVNPDHLQPVTRQANLAERDQRHTRKAVCKHGHPMVGDNIGWTTRACGRIDRYCRACQYASNRASYARHAEKRRAYARDRYQSDPEYAEMRRVRERERQRSR